MSIAARLRDLIDERRLTQSEVAELADLPEETVGRIVRGDTANPSLNTLTKLAQGLEVTVGWLLAEKGFEFSTEHRRELRRIVRWGEEVLKATEPERTPLQASNVSAVAIGRKPPHRAPRKGRPVSVSATDWRESFDDWREERDVEIPQQFADRGATLVFRAEGESMTGEYIADGDLLYVVEEADARHARGRIIVCVVDGSRYVKRLDFAEPKIRLVSANERFSPMVFDENAVDWKLVGIVVGWSHDAK